VKASRSCRRHALSRDTVPPAAPGGSIPGGVDRRIARAKDAHTCVITRLCTDPRNSWRVSSRAAGGPTKMSTRRRAGCVRARTSSSTRIAERSAYRCSVACGRRPSGQHVHAAPGRSCWVVPWAPTSRDEPSEKPVRFTGQ